MALNANELINIILGPDKITKLQGSIEDTLGNILRLEEGFKEGSGKKLVNEYTKLVDEVIQWTPGTSVGVPIDETVFFTLAKDEIAPPSDEDTVVTRLSLKKGSSSFIAPSVYVIFIKDEDDNITDVKYQVYGSCEQIEYEDLFKRYRKVVTAADGTQEFSNIDFPNVNSNQECFNIAQNQIGEDPSKVGVYIDESTKRNYVLVNCDIIPDSFPSCNNPTNEAILKITKDGNDYFQVWNGQPEVDGEPNSQWKAGYTGFATLKEKQYVYTEDNLESSTLTFIDRDSGDEFIPNPWVDFSALSDEEVRLVERQTKRVYLWTSLCEYSKDQMTDTQAEIWNLQTEAVFEWLPYLDNGLPVNIDAKTESATVNIVRETNDLETPPTPDGQTIYRNFEDKELYYDFNCDSVQIQTPNQITFWYEDENGNVLDLSGANKPEYEIKESQFYAEDVNPTLVLKNAVTQEYDGWLDKSGGANAPQSSIGGKDAIKYIPQRGSNEVVIQTMTNIMITDLINYIVNNMEVDITIPSGTVVTDASLVETEVTNTTSEYTHYHRHGGTGIPDEFTHDHTYTTKEYSLDVTKGEINLSVSNGEIVIT